MNSRNQGIGGRDTLDYNSLLAEFLPGRGIAQSFAMPTQGDSFHDSAHLKKLSSMVGNIENLELADIIDAEIIESLMDYLYRFAGIPMNIVNLKGEVLAGVRWQDICTRFHRAHPESRKHCIESNLAPAADMPKGQFRLYKCLNNMWVIATPILVFGKHLGNVLSGQFFFDDEPVDHDLFRAQAAKYGFDEREYMSALEAVPRLNRDSVDAGISSFVRIADLIAGLSYQNIRLARSLAEKEALTAYLRQNKQDLNRAQAVAKTGSWRLDVATNALTWSEETGRIFQMPAGTPLTYEKFLSAVHPEDREYVDRKWSEALNGGPYDIEHRIVAGGRVKWVSEKAELEFDEAGKFLGGFGTVQDITDRKTAEANRALLTDTLRVLNRGGDLHQLIAETLRLIRAAGEFDAVGLRLRFEEDCPYFEHNGFSEEFLQEENFLCLKTANGSTQYDQAGRAILECTCGLVLSGQTKNEVSCLTEGGSFWTNSSHDLLGLPIEDDPRTNPRNRCIHAGYESVGLFPVRSGKEILGLLQLNGREANLFTPESVVFYETLAQNIGLALQRTMAEEALKKAHAQLQEHARRLEETNKELEGFAYTISHDLRTPLRAINGFARMVAEDYGPSLEEEAKRRLAVIEANAVKMGMLIDGLLAFSRVSRTEVNICSLDMNRLVADVAEKVKTLNGDTKFEMHISPLPAAQGDPVLIRQVLANLLGNAVKFSRNNPAPRIEVGSFQKDGEQVYWVKDQGAGFDMKYSDKLFRVFERLVSEKEFEGTGVGLAIAQRIIQRHGGRIWAEGKIREGSTFYFTLPTLENNRLPVS